MGQPWRAPAGGPLIRSLVGPTMGHSFLCTEHSLLPRFPLIEMQKEECQAIEFKQKGLRQFISHLSNFAVYICKPHLFTCPVFVKVNSFGGTT